MEPQYNLDFPKRECCDFIDKAGLGYKTCKYVSNSTSIFPTWHVYHIFTELFKWFECVVLAETPERPLWIAVSGMGIVGSVDWYVGVPLTLLGPGGCLGLSAISNHINI